MAFNEEAFEQISSGDGEMELNMMGQIQKMPYTATNFVNSAGTIGYADVVAEGKSGYIFMSKTASGVVMTMPGDQTAEMPFPVPDLRLRSVDQNNPIEVFYTEHLTNLGEEEPEADRDWLVAELPNAPQRSMDAAMKAMEAMLAGMGDMMSQMGEAMGTALGGGGDGEGGGELGQQLGDLMAGAMEQAFSEMGDQLPEEGPEAVPAHETECPGCGAMVDEKLTECPDCGEELD